MGRKLDEFIQKYLDIDNKVPAEYKEAVAEGLKNELKKEFFNDYRAELLSLKQDVNQQKANEIALRRFLRKNQSVKADSSECYCNQLFDRDAGQSNNRPYNLL